MGLEAVTYIADLVITNPLSGDFKSEGDDHLRNLKIALQNTLPGLAGAFGRVQVKGAGYTVLATDNCSVIQASTLIQLDLTAAATLGNKHSFVVDADGGEVTIEPAGAELINGAANFIVPRGQIAFVWCTGTAFSVAMMPKASAAVQVITGDIVLTTANLAGQKEVTALADITLPAASTALIGTKTLIHSSTTARVRIVPNGTNTIEGLNANYRLPSWTTIELMCISATGFILLRSPQYAVGQLVPMAVAQTLPGFVPGDFAALSRTTYGGLFDLIGTTHGIGDNSTTFNVPDTRGRSLIGAGSGSTVEAVDAAAVTTGSDTFTVVSNVDKWVTGMPVQLTTTSALPAGLALLTTYWIIRSSATLIKFASSLALAQVGTAIDITTQGTGVHTVTHTLSARSTGVVGGEEAHAMSSAEALNVFSDSGHTHGENVFDGTNGQTSMIGWTGGSTSNSSGPVPAAAANTGTGSFQVTTSSGNAAIVGGGNSSMNNESPFGVAQFYVKT